VIAKKLEINGDEGQQCALGWGYLFNLNRLRDWKYKEGWERRQGGIVYIYIAFPLTGTLPASVRSMVLVAQLEITGRRRWVYW